MYGNAPVGHCGYCGKAVYEDSIWWAVPTIVGMVRLCLVCADNEPARLAVSRDAWLHGTSVPARWRNPAGTGRVRRRRKKT